MAISVGDIMGFRRAIDEHIMRPEKNHPDQQEVLTFGDLKVGDEFLFSGTSYDKLNEKEALNHTTLQVERFDSDNEVS